MTPARSVNPKEATYKIKNGKYYSVPHEKYIDESFVDQTKVIDISTQQVADDPTGEKNLRENLVFNKLPIGDVLLTVEELKKQKLQQLSDLATKALEHGKITSSLGFKVDATKKAIEDTEGLIKVLEVTGRSTVSFCDADNEFHNITLDQVKTINLEIIDYKQKVYAKKWNIRESIASATTKAELEKIEVVI